MKDYFLRYWLLLVLVLICGIIFGVIITICMGIDNNWLVPVMSLVGLLPTIGIFIKVLLEYKSRMSVSEIENKRNYYAKLCGLKNKIRWLYYNHLESQIDAFYTEALAINSGNKFFEEQEKRYRKMADDLKLQFMDVEQELFEVLSHIQTLFPNIPDLKQKVRDIDMVQIPEIEHYSLQEIAIDNLGQVELMNKLQPWQNGQHDVVNTWISEKIENPLDEIISYIKI